MPRTQGALSEDLLNHRSLDDRLIVRTAAGFDLIPADEDLTALPALLRSAAQAELTLKRSLSGLKSQYDLIVIDTPPSLDLVTIMALCAADQLLITTPCEYYALDSLQTLLSKTAKLQEEGLFAGQLAGIVRTMYDADALQSDEIKNTLQKLGPQLCSTVIPYSAVISEAAALGRPVMQYDKSSNGARAYLALAGELISRLHL